MKRVAFAMTLLTLVTGLVGVASAQFVPEVGTTASILGRGNAGVALTNEAATGLMNPAALPMRYRLPAPSVEGLAARPDHKGEAVATVRDQPPLLRLDGVGEVGSGGILSVLPQAAMGRPAPPVTIEVRFLQIDQRFLERIGYDWEPGSPGFEVGYSTDTASNDDLSSLQGTYGRLGGNTAWGFGFAEDNRNDFMYVAAGRQLAASSGGATVSVGAKVAHNDVTGCPKRLTADVGVLLDVTPTISPEGNIRLTVGAVGRDIFDSYDFLHAGRRLDLGIGATGRKFRVGLDVVDLLDDTDLFGQKQTGRRINTGVEMEAGPVVLMGGLRDGEETYGARVEIPLLGRLPSLLSFAFSKSHEREQAELVVFITPRITRASED